MISVGIVGYGYWGPNLLRAFSRCRGARVKAVCDSSTEHLVAARHHDPALLLATSFEELLADPAIDAMVIATPVASHFELALAALRSGRHVLVEKPMTATSEEATRLVEEAARRRLTLMVDHPYVYSTAVRKIAELLDGGGIGELYYYDSVRINLGRFRSDVDVMWDLAAHDLAILDFLTGRQPRRVSVTGASHFGGGLHDIAYLSMFYGDVFLAHVHVNWCAPVKVRRTLLGGSRQMIVYDDLEPSEKVKVYDRSVALAHDERQVRIGYRAGDVWTPHLEVADALEEAATDFVHCVNHGARPRSSGEMGLRVVRLLEAASRSLHGDGQPVEIPADAFG
jgi:predicted dehydrogenase